MKRFFLIFACFAMLSFSARADEGMWLLPYLQKVNYADMKAKGLKLKADDIYNAQGTSLKDAIVIFGRGCTGEIVSPDGLIFTNHHCGYGNIQQLSTVEHDYLKNGFWAMNRSEEIPVPGLTVHFVRAITDVTAIVTAGTTADTPESERDEIVGKNIKALNKQMQEENPGKKIEIKSYFGGNEFFACVLEEYTDIRFVGAPPTSIGKFGGETDNWMWPRHTGDFSIFRVYSAADGSPAKYSKDNVPYKAPVHLTISAQGYKEGDFAMVMGFPGTTTRFMTTYEIDEMLDVANPNRIYVRGERQAILKKDMEASDKVRIQYASKYASSSNYWKNSIGKSNAVRKLGIRDQKQELEDRFQRWAEASPSRARYAKALPQISDAKAKMITPSGDAQYLMETVFSGIEISGLGYSASRNLKANIDAGRADKFIEALYKDYNEATDKKVTKRMIEILFDRVPAESQPEFLTVVTEKFGGDAGAYTDWLYETSIFANEDKLKAFAADFDEEKMDNDPAPFIYRSTLEKYYVLRDEVQKVTDDYYEGQRLYIDGLRQMQPDKMFYPDANFTIRLTYGTVQPYSPADAIYYDYSTTLAGVMEKEDPQNPTEFTVSERLKALYASQDYGRYAAKRTKKEIKRGVKPYLNTCFISTNDITGGNSGSPVLNAKGQLIGLAFDGNWEAMSGDVLFEPELQRCINVDVRYVLFVIDKFAGAGHLLDEMTIIW